LPSWTGGKTISRPESSSDPPTATSMLGFMVTFTGGRSHRLQEGDPGLLDGGNLLWECLHASARSTSFKDTLLNEGALAHRLPSGSSLATALKGTMDELVVGETVRTEATINDAMSRGETIKAFSSEVQRNLSTRHVLAPEKLLIGAATLHPLPAMLVRLAGDSGEGQSLG
jgi:hypothetical protein